MTCPEAQLNLSLYLYGELEFAKEEELERHLAECALCERALTREKNWHASVNAEKRDLPLNVLSGCRQDLRNALQLSAPSAFKSSFARWAGWLGFSTSNWSFRIAVASFLVFIGFSLGQFVDRNGGNSSLDSTAQMGLLGPYTSHIKNIQAGSDGRVNIIYDQTRQEQVMGQVDSRQIRTMLLAAAKNAADPGLQVDSVDILKSQSGDDVRDVLLDVAEHDGNAGVRLRALGALRQFAGDPTTRQGITFVLGHDDNPGVRSQAIDLLVPLTERTGVSPELESTLKTLVSSEQNDDYLRMRCVQILQNIGAPPVIY